MTHGSRVIGLLGRLKSLITRGTRVENPLERLREVEATLPEKLQVLRSMADETRLPVSLLAWGRRKAGMESDALEAWSRRAWWGLVAGRLVKEHLWAADTIDSALALMEPADWSLVDDAMARGGAICAAAHVGPPKFALCLLSRRMPRLLAWTSVPSFPDWLQERPHAVWLDPNQDSHRANVLVRSAIHLRQGGVLFGAPDGAWGRTTSVSANGSKRYALGIPTLSRQLNIPVLLVMALWAGERVRLVVTRLEPPPSSLDEDGWNNAWVTSYARKVNDAIAGAPENLRDLQWAENGAIVREAGL